MTVPVFGTAHLFATVPPEQSERLIRAALELGFAAIDTAPSYGYGRSEESVGRALREHGASVEVTTKVGIVAMPQPTRSVRLAKSLARRLPDEVQRRLRGSGSGARPAEQGHFALGEVRSGIEQSLRRLRRIDRLLLHEVRPDDLTDELLDELARYRTAGDVGQLGVATGNAQSAACVARAPELFTTANVSIAPSAMDPGLPSSVTNRVGHGVFGPGGSELTRLTRGLRGDRVRAAGWQAATVGTPWGDPGGLADALLARATQTAAVDGVIIASSRADRLARVRGLLAEAAELPCAARAIVDALCDDAAPV